MSNWQEAIAPFVRSVEKVYDRAKYRLYRALGELEQIKIVPYRGYGTRETLYLKGRVLKARGITPAGEADSLWRNFINMWKRLASREVPYARVQAEVQTLKREVQADEEGMFEVQIDPPSPLPEDPLWHTIALTLLEPQPEGQEEKSVNATGKVLVPPSSARFAVISDVDDTVLQTDAPDFLRMMRNTFLGNARTRLPLPGVAAFYRALHAGETGYDYNPLFYVSNSPWNFYDLLSEFFQLHDIPIGPVLLLRNWGIYKDEVFPTDQRKHKLPIIRKILELYPDLPFILIGDSGEADPEIYEEIVSRYPGRVLAIYIRNVGQDLKRPASIQVLAKRVKAAGSDLILADDSLTLARHAAEQGWIQRKALKAITEEIQSVQQDKPNRS
jgi:phosphatidate phosphatase APP1